ncbi:MAG: hypothetical protein E7663_06470 [Ruminococcaceae bacterium]|nr:hypothetical protein [Oscillospiraceae bacterium]
MKCEKCLQNEATYYYEETVNGKTRSLHLCAECAKKMQSGQIPKEDSAPDLFSSPLPDLLGDLFGLSPKKTESAKRCPDCGALWQDLVSCGKACCPTCYKTFAQELERTVRAIHGNVTHTGRAPAGFRAVHEKEQRIAALKKELAAAITDENFEKAAELRDEIRKLTAN